MDGPILVSSIGPDISIEYRYRYQYRVSVLIPVLLIGTDISIQYQSRYQYWVLVPISVSSIGSNTRFEYHDTDTSFICMCVYDNFVRFVFVLQWNLWQSPMSTVVLNVKSGEVFVEDTDLRAGDWGRTWTRMKPMLCRYWTYCWRKLLEISSIQDSSLNLLGSISAESVL